MASMNAGKGAAEEPEPEPSPPPSSSSSAGTTAGAAAASYDPREYQPAHPDDRDGNPTKPGKAKTKGKGGAEGKGKDDGTHRCGNCDAPNAKRKCMRCGVERYCGKECQAVRAVW